MLASRQVRLKYLKKSRRLSRSGRSARVARRGAFAPDELGAVEQGDQRIPVWSLNAWLRRQLAQRDEPIDGVVRRLLAAQPFQRNAAMYAGTFDTIGWMIEIRPPAGEQHARLAGLGPTNGGVQQLL
jgi:hypothetical protein